MTSEAEARVYKLEEVKETCIPDATHEVTYCMEQSVSHRVARARGGVLERTCEGERHVIPRHPRPIFRLGLALAEAFEPRRVSVQR